MKFELPAIGEGVTEGELVRWLVKEGDTVAVDQPLVEIMTDKATVEIPSPHAGRVTSIHAKPGELVKVGQLLIEMEEGAAKTAPKTEQVRPAAPKIEQARPVAQTLATAHPQKASHAVPPSRAPQAPTGATPPTPTRAPQAAVAAHHAEMPVAPTYMATPGQVLATPSTRRLARDLGIDIGRIPGSGPQGRVTKEDVQKYAGASVAGAPSIGAPAMGTPVTGVASSRAGGPAASAQAPIIAPTPTIERRYTPGAGPAERETLVPFRGVRRKIAEAMVKSRTAIPEFTYVDECDVTELVALREEAKAMAEAQGVKLTYLPFVMKALIKGLKAYPYMNASLDEQGGNVVLKNYFNIGVSVDTPDGLMVPVIKDADRKSILEIAAELQDLTAKARGRKIALEDLQGGTFSITSPGNIGGVLSTPVINWPEVAILGMHKITRRPVVRGNEIKIADVVYLSITVDHRVVDGASAARFLNVVIDYLSHPKKLMLDMA